MIKEITSNSWIQLFLRFFTFLKIFFYLTNQFELIQFCLLGFWK